ncbi:MAG: helix-turn-helix transcriptional regulator [Oscillospiraceae bacterium]|nr:helix-turn-helix transcriptional regulator [Oscillospiraceae bacterium]MBQ9929597.1 helix-turn-helix transcriptional regulator [Oscillospiraceae bacterium]
MIVYDKLWATMEKKNVSTYWLREKCGIDRKTIRRLRANDNIETKTLNKLCSALDCKLEDIAQFVPDINTD